MKKSWALSFSLIILLILMFVLVNRTKQELISVRLVSETTEITYTDSESIQIFENAISAAKKVPGAVDVPPPNYRMTVTYADSEVVEYSFYMNIETKNGFLIKQSDSEKMLDLKEQNAKELAELLGKKEKIM